MKANRPYKTVKGQRIPVTASEMKSYIMRVHGWTSDEYNRQRYIMKNKLRTYEAFTGVDQAKAQSPVNIMYFQAKSIAEAQRRGETYTPSLEMQRLQQFSGLGSSKQIQKALQNQRTQERWGKRYEETTYQRFAGLISSTPMAREIAEAISDPVKREQALIAYANALKLNEKQKRDALAGEAVPIFSGEVAGYGDFDFDYSDYLD